MLQWQPPCKCPNAKRRNHNLILVPLKCIVRKHVRYIVLHAALDIIHRQTPESSPTPSTPPWLSRNNADNIFTFDDFGQRPMTSESDTDNDDDCQDACTTTLIWQIRNMKGRRNSQQYCSRHHYANYPGYVQTHESTKRIPPPSYPRLTEMYCKETCTVLRSFLEQ